MLNEQLMEFDDETFMALAIEEALKAKNINEVPIGAVVVFNQKVIGRGYNLRETNMDPTAHAEIIALREAAQTLGGWRLTGCDLYVTIEPCAMCTGAIIQSRIRRLIIGAYDKKAGACGGAFDLLNDPHHNHRVEMIAGISEFECSSLISDFFKALRSK